jgi:hypothetical protein
MSWIVRCTAVIGMSIASLVVANASGATTSVRANSDKDRSAAFSGKLDGTLNWAGYRQSGKDLSSIQAQWTVPPEPKAIPGKTSDVSLWIGVGGVSGPLVQEGISWESKSGGTPQLFGWYEFVNGKNGTEFCCNLVKLSLPGLAAGDDVAALLFEDSSTLWHFALNVSKGTKTLSDQNFLATSCERETVPVVVVASPALATCKAIAVQGDDAEAILERALSNGKPVELALTPPVTFSKAIIYDGANGYSGPLAADVAGLTLYREYMSTKSSLPPTNAATLAYPEAPTQSGEQFVVKDGPEP